MHILSIYFGHDGAFSIAKDNNLIMHCQLDRFNRVKHSCELPGHVLIYLQSLNIIFDFILLIDLNEGDNSIDETHHKIIFKNFKLINNDTKIINFSKDKNKKHHILHAYCSKATVGENKNYFIADGGGVIDETGEYERESIYDEKFNLVSSYKKRIGLRYGNVTSKLFNTTYKYGFHYCGKTMALSQYGDKIIESASNLNEEMSNIECQNFLYSLQKRTEKDLIEIMPKENVNYSGGVAQNILANNNFIHYKNFKIDPMCIDSGISLGLINYFLKGSLNKVESMYLGPEPNYDYLSLFNKYEIISVEVKDVTKILKDEPVALFQGRSEQGQRGLGNRSLLMNCHHSKAIEKINVIKKREWYRPFSPSVIEEKAEDYFDMQGITSPYMLYAFKTKQPLKNVSAFDGSSRVQTVNKHQNSAFYELLKASGDMLLNTSLNFPGQVLVENLLDLKYMLDMSPLKYAWLPDINQLIVKK
tara:strand:- start:589 stop:2010 length:1422 start_codon:yes stop_codon:yes gene_type:complete